MALTPLLKTAIILNNYFHDVATAMLLSSALVMWLLGRKAASDGPDARRWFAGSYDVLSKIAIWSIVWIVVGGVPRAVFFQQVEWNLADPSNKYLFMALVIKHALMWLAVGVGAVMWLRMRTVAKGILAEDAGAASAKAPATDAG